MAEWEHFYRQLRALRGQADTLRDLIRDVGRNKAVDKEYHALVEQFDFVSAEMADVGVDPAVNPLMTKEVEVIRKVIKDVAHLYQKTR